jgi:putative salt-induced outer membrane protein YdiY
MLQVACARCGPIINRKGIPMRTCVLLAALFFCASATADVIVFRNGDRLSGRIMHKHNTVLVFETLHAGTINVNWGDILTLSTQKPVAVMIRDDNAVTSEILEAGTEGHVVLRDSQRSIPLQDIAYINPTSEQSGVGILYSGRANLSATDTQGNSTGRRIYAEAALAARTRDYRYNIGGKLNRQQEFGRQTASNWQIDGNYDWFLDKRTFRYVRSSFEHDQFKDIDLRSTVGGGYGLQLAETPRTNISVRGGLDYVAIDHATAANEDYPALGWGLRASHRLDMRNIELFHEQDGFAQIANGSNVTLRSRTGVRVPIASRLNVSVQLNLDWEKEPAPGRKSTDSVLLIGLGYEW